MMDMEQFVKVSNYHVDKLIDLLDLSYNGEESFKLTLEIGIQLIHTALMAYKGAKGECEMNELTESVISEIYRRLDSGLDAESFNQQ